MKKRKIQLNRKLVLNKTVVAQLAQQDQQNILGGDGQTQSYANAQNCLCWKDPNYTAVACPTNQFLLTCRPQECGLEQSAISCIIGPGCASGNGYCQQPNTTACTIGV